MVENTYTENIDITFGDHDVTLEFDPAPDLLPSTGFIVSLTLEVSEPVPALAPCGGVPALIAGLLIIAGWHLSRQRKSHVPPP